MPQPPPNDPPVKYVGTATMRADRTLIVEVQIKQDGVISGGTKRYRPGDPHYGEVIDHIGGIKPGETKLVPEWSPRTAD